MYEEFLHFLKKLLPEEHSARREAMARALADHIQVLAHVLASLPDQPAHRELHREIIAQLNAATLSLLTNGQARRLTPEEREWALKEFSEEAILAGIREIRETGGLELKDFMHEIDAILDGRESAGESRFS